MERVDNKRLSGTSPDSKPPPILGVFAKEPVPGKVKTRLCPPLDPGEAAELYRCLQRETLISMAATGFPLVVFYAGDPEYFAAEFPGLRLVSQGEGDLGVRMERALKLLLEEGAPAAALIGTDSPDLPPTLVQDALAALDRAEFVIIPARDGGYVLVGESRHCPQMFHAIPWSTSDVLAATRRCAEDSAVAYREIEQWEDIDDVVSLQRFLRRSPHSATALHVRRRIPHLLP